MVDVNTDQFFDSVQLTVLNKRGEPAPVDGTPVWASSDETVLQAVPDFDGMTGKVLTVAPGTARITVSVDADLGAGVRTITGVSEDVVVTLGPSSEASTLTLVLGAPSDKPAA